MGSRRPCPYAAVVTGPVFEFSEVFDEDYLYFYGPHLEAVSDAQTETVWRLLKLEPGMEVLDLACGHGRIANRLAQRGVQVTGLDATPLFLEQARRDAAERGVEVDYVCGDMRSLPWPEHRFERVSAGSLPLATSTTPKTTRSCPRPPGASSRRSAADREQQPR